METRKYILTVECKDEEHADSNFIDIVELLDDLKHNHEVIEGYYIERVEDEKEPMYCTMTDEDQEHYGQCMDPQCPYYQEMSEEKRVNAIRIGMILNSNIQ